MAQHGLLRPLKAAELSDGTLRYLLLVAALLSPRPPDLMILNEPETSLHPDLLGPLARLIAQASQRSQIMVVSHAATLVSDLEGAAELNLIVLQKHLGETLVRRRSETRVDMAVTVANHPLRGVGGVATRSPFTIPYNHNELVRGMS